MTQPPKFYNQPLGTIMQLDKIIETFPQEQSHDQTRNLTIIYAKRKLEVQIPINWTVNKLKCMMAIHFQTLSFDKFEFQCNKFLIPGKTTVDQLPNEQLIVTQAQCPKAFQVYYKQNMKKVIKTYNITTQNPMYPITHRSLSQDMFENIPKGRISNIVQIPQNRRRQQPQGMIINILRIIGIAFMSNLIFTFASFGQIAILLCVALVYYLIDEYVKYNDRKRREQEKLAQLEAKKKKQQITKESHTNQKEQNQQVKQQSNQIKTNTSPNIELQSQQHQIEQGEQPIQNVSISKQQLYVQKKQKTQRKSVKAKVIYWVAFLTEFLYCYILSIFPNWTVETHLHANQEKLDKVMSKIKQLDPEASQLIKKWESKQNSEDEIKEQ